MAYYNNPGMLARQYAHWAGFGEEVRQFLDIIIVDDGSQQDAVDVERPRGLPPLQIYRVHEDFPWNQNGARNLGALKAEGDWLLLTDMDHMFPEETLLRLKEVAKPGRVYRFRRLDFDTREPTADRKGQEKPHPNTWALTRKMYWDVGGYDERTCGYYGTDSFFRAKLEKAGYPFVLVKSPVWRFDTKMVADANTTTLPRKQGRPDGWRERLQAKLRSSPQPDPCGFHWYRTYPE
jgi:glycosyltransferase involved in cell wall biosynthesis